MKEIYSFFTEKVVEKEVPFSKKGDDGKIIESTKKDRQVVKTRTCFVKPSMAVIEEAEFFYGQKFNEYINSGFLTKAMLNKKMGDSGGMTSKMSTENLQKAILENINASKIIEFYGSSKSLTEDQQEKLREAEGVYINTKTLIIDYEQAIRSQYSQTADSKAEQKLIEWFVFNQSFYEEEVGDKRQLFPLFEGENFEEKRYSYLAMCENIEDISDSRILKTKAIFDQAFTTLVRVASIWYNKIAENQQEIEVALKDMFEDNSDAGLQIKVVNAPKKKNKKKILVDESPDELNE